MFGWTMDKMLDRNSLILLVVVLLIPVVNWIWWRHRRLTLLSRNGIPGPRSRFLDGNFFDVIHKNVPMLDKWIKEYGKVTGYIVGVPTVAVADAELVRLIQVKVSQELVFTTLTSLYTGFSPVHITSVAVFWSA